MLPVSLAIFPRKLGTAVKIQEVATGGGAAWELGRREGVTGRAVTSLLFWGLSSARRGRLVGTIISERFGDSCLEGCALCSTCCFSGNRVGTIHPFLRTVDSFVLKIIQKLIHISPKKWIMNWYW